MESSVNRYSPEAAKILLTIQRVLGVDLHIPESLQKASYKEVRLAKQITYLAIRGIGCSQKEATQLSRCYRKPKPSAEMVTAAKVLVLVSQGGYDDVVFRSAFAKALDSQRPLKRDAVLPAHLTRERIADIVGFTNERRRNALI